MTMLLLEQFLVTATRALPRLFLYGVPLAVIVMATAAFLDTKVPGTSTGEHPVHPSAQARPR